MNFNNIAALKEGMELPAPASTLNKQVWEIRDGVAIE